MAKEKLTQPPDPEKKPGDLAHGVQRERGVPQVEKETDEPVDPPVTPETPEALETGDPEGPHPAKE